MKSKDKKYIIKTYGCQMNELDSERISFMLENIGYTVTDDINDADIIIYNTCIIRENAELKVYGHLGAMKALKAKKPNLMIAVCGCMMQVEEARDMIREKYKHVDIVFGTKNISSLPYLISQHLADNSRIIDIESADDINEFQNAVRKSDLTAYINIIYGCDNFCSYCIVPYTRGREISRSVESILKEIEMLREEGYREITLLGQNVNSYGKDLHPCSSFAHLLQRIEEIDGIDRIRFMTSHPKDLSDELIEVIKTSNKVCEHVHLPLQSGSTRVLKKMNRKYSAKDYLSITEKLKSSISELSITTDIIVGFPGETDDDFEQTVEMVKKVKFDQAFIFKYSRRTGTSAAKMENQVDEETVSLRFKRILDTVNDICYERNSLYMNKEVEVLVEGESKNDPSVLTGRTRTNKIVHFKSKEPVVGELVIINITGFNSFALEGEIVR